MLISNVTIGADPELFIINSKTGKVVSSIGLIPGVKGNPYVDECMPNGFGLETDNILAEFNIPPCRNKAEFINNIEWMKNYIRSFVQSKDPDLDIKCSASEIVDDDQLRSKEAKLFGCSVDYNVYTEDVNPKPQGEVTNLRSAGMHIHVGYDNYNTATSLQLIRLFDLFVGVPSVLLDNDTRRRDLYGKAGAFRLTPYGFEYRVLSSYMMSSPELLQKVWNYVVNAIHRFNEGFNCNSARSVVEAINNSDKNIAEILCKKYKITV